MSEKHCFPVGKYRLGDQIDALNGLTEFAPQEYSVIGRAYEGEVIYNAPPVAFLGRTWKLKIAAVKGKVYKLAPHLEFENEEEANSAAAEVLSYCLEVLGGPVIQWPGLTRWDVADGNVVLGAGGVPGVFYQVDLALPSNSVEAFSPGFPDEGALLKTFGKRVFSGLVSLKQYDRVKRTLLVAFTTELNDPDLAAACIAYALSEAPAGERAGTLLAEHGPHIQRRIEDLLSAEADVRDLTGFALFHALWSCFVHGGSERRDAIMGTSLFTRFGPITPGQKWSERWASLEECEISMRKVAKRYGMAG